MPARTAVSIFVTMVTITINKALVLDEVAKTTSYIGAKASDDGTLYEHIFTTDEDRVMLERFWLEACSVLTDALRPWLLSVDAQTPSTEYSLSNNYVAVLGMPGNWDTALEGSVNESLFAYMANSIVAKWFLFTAKEEAETYATVASGMLSDATGKLYSRKRPSRPEYADESPTPDE